MIVLIFITTILNEAGKAKVAPALNFIAGMYQWSIDLSDCDKVLRVEAEMDISASIIHILGEYSFECRKMIY